MFKYVKTFNAASGGVEPEYLPVKDTDTFTQGCVCELSVGYLANTITDGKTKFVTLDEKTPGDGKKKLPCMRVLPGMVFETLYVGDESMLYPGNCLNFDTDTKGCHSIIRPETAKYVEIVDCTHYDDQYAVLAVTINR